MNEDARTGYAEDANGNVVLTMTKDDYQWLLIAMGFYIGGQGCPPQAPGVWAWVNRINAGNPTWTPYATEPTGETA